MSYTGVLWELDQNASDRTAPLSDADRKWIESLFDGMPTGESKIAK
jgi:hypothetical protein